MRPTVLLLVLCACEGPAFTTLDPSTQNDAGPIEAAILAELKPDSGTGIGTADGDTGDALPKDDSGQATDADSGPPFLCHLQGGLFTCGTESDASTPVEASTPPVEASTPPVEAGPCTYGEDRCAPDERSTEKCNSMSVWSPVETCPAELSCRVDTTFGIGCFCPIGETQCGGGTVTLTCSTTGVCP